MARFDGQTVIFTGAAAGIGLEIATAFHDARASVVLSDVRPEAPDQARVGFSDLSRVSFVQVDVRTAESVAGLITAAG